MAEQGGGPFLQMAVMCEKALQETDGVLSVIRIVDRLTIPGARPVQITGVINFNSGFAQGRYTVKLRPQTPSGKSMGEREFPVLFEGDERGVTLLADIGFVAEEEGLYWFDVLLGEAVVTRIPVRILYQSKG